MDDSANKTQERSAWLISGNESIEVSVRIKSRYALLLRYDSKNKFFTKSSESEHDLFFALKPQDELMRIGPCRLLKNSFRDEKEYNGILVHNQDLVDFHLFFDKDEIAGLDRLYQNLNLIFDQKEKIKPEFREYTARLTYDLQVYKEFFENAEDMIRKENKKLRKELEISLINGAGRKFMQFYDNRLAELEMLVKDYNREEHYRHGFYFRKQVWQYILASEFLARTNIKPRGYPGDSEMMNMVYKNSYEGKTVFEKLLHKHPVETAAAQAVRNRRALIPAILKEIHKDFSKKKSEKLSILSVACGPAFEMQDLFLSGGDCRKFKVTLMDQDTEALEEAGDNIKKLEKKFGKKIEHSFLTDSVRTMLKTRHVSEKMGSYDFIYSMGLFDYLTPPVAKAIVGKLYQLLRPGGQMIIGNYHVQNPTRIYMDYWMDWVLYYRTEQDFLEMVPDVKEENKSIIFEDTKCQMFLVVKKS